MKNFDPDHSFFSQQQITSTGIIFSIYISSACLYYKNTISFNIII